MLVHCVGSADVLNPFQFHFSLGSENGDPYYMIDWSIAIGNLPSAPLPMPKVSIMAFGKDASVLDVFVSGKFNGFVSESDAGMLSIACYTAIVPLPYLDNSKVIHFAPVSVENSKDGAVQYLSPAQNFTITDPSAMRWAVFGDLGTIQQGRASGISIPALLKEFQAGKFQAFMHIGDIGYEFINKNGKDYMDSLAPILARAPVQATVGNVRHYFFLSIAPC